MKIPRPEHPVPQWERANWKNLNGEWEFEFDFGKSAKERKLWEKDKLNEKIIVPFCPESKLSGIGYTDFFEAAAYKREFEITKEELSGRVFLHFGAVDYFAEIYVNRNLTGSHKGGYTPFSLDITDYIREGKNELFVWIADDLRSGLQCAGKQASKYASSGCDYTRTTGIWQTVWLEFVPDTYIKYARYYADVKNSMVMIEGETSGSGILKIRAEFEGRVLGECEIVSSGGFFAAQMKLSELHLWEPGNGRLYDLFLDYGRDFVKSYFGMRSVRFEGKKFLINEKPLFQRLVLDQGYYPSGIYTAPSEEDLIKDIKLSLAAGFNGARLHEKVFEPRFLYHCDRLGYIVWGEYPNWKLDHKNPLASEIYMNEWQEVLERDFNHPSIIGWCPFNESWGYREENEKNVLISSIYKLTKRIDPTRPCIDVSGNYHVMPEVYDIHDYDQNPDTLRERWESFSKLKKEKGVILPSEDLIKNHEYPFHFQAYRGGPVFISECGGIQWNTNGNAGWGYGTAPETEEEFIKRFEGIIGALMENGDICGFCYTQLYDIEQEINGLYTYEREPKFDMEIFKRIVSKKAKTEE